MKKPILNYFQRQVIHKTNSYYKDVLLFELAKLRLKRDLDKMFSPIFEPIIKWINTNL